MPRKLCRNFKELEKELLKIGHKSDLKSLSEKLKIREITLRNWFFSGVSIPLSRLDLLTSEFNLGLK